MCVCGRAGGLKIRTRKILDFFYRISNHHNLPPYLCAGNFSIILLHILCAFKQYVEYLCRHIFLVDTCTRIRLQTPADLTHWPMRYVRIRSRGVEALKSYGSHIWTRISKTPSFGGDKIRHPITLQHLNIS